MKDSFHLRRGSLLLQLLLVFTLCFIIIIGCQKEDDVDVGDPKLTPREQAIETFNTYFLGSAVSNPEWTGNVANCDAGTVPQHIQEKVLMRIKYYRMMCGLPSDLTMDTAQSRKCQEAALMSRANHSLSHNPPPSWTCYTADGREACARSNLSLGNHSVNAVSSQMRDAGINNKPVGHRRWILYPPLQKVGHGSTSNSQALWVLGNSAPQHPANMPEFVSWPPKGYVPAPVVYGRWSLSVPQAQFGNATVTMICPDGLDVPLEVVSKTDVGYGDNTIVWEPQGITLNHPDDRKYTVNVEGVILQGNPVSYHYEVIIIQPAG